MAAADSSRRFRAARNEGGRLTQTVVITHPEKVMFPDDGITKGELAAYYEAVAPVMLPHLQGRPISMERFHRGIGAPGFFQKNVEKGAPAWLKRLRVPKKDGVVHHPAVTDARGLVWLANQNCITPHVWTSRAPRITRPDICIFDLDPSAEERATLLNSSRRADHMVMAVPIYYTADMVRALPDDGNRYETVHGELLVTPAPRLDHQHVLGELFVRLHAYLRAHPVGKVFMSPADISWAPDVLVQPDLFVVPLKEAEPREWKDIRTLLLAIEVLSPSSRRHDRFTKRRVYQEHDLPVYWIVDPEARLAEGWTPAATGPVIVSDRLVWHPVGAREPLTIHLAEVLPPA